MSEWTSLNVVEWMAALNLYRYADVFKSKDIKGSDLPFLDRDKLMVSQFFFPPPRSSLIAIFTYFSLNFRTFVSSSAVNITGR